MFGTVRGSRNRCCSKGASVLIGSFALGEWRQQMEPMRAHAIAVLVAGMMLSAGVVLPGPAGAQSNSAQSPAADLETSAIGKVVTATGSVTIEHASAVVVQANVPAGSGVGRTKIGDPVYKGDVVQTGAD